MTTKKKPETADELRARAIMHLDDRVTALHALCDVEGRKFRLEVLERLGEIDSFRVALMADFQTEAESIFAEVSDEN